MKASAKRIMSMLVSMVLLVGSLVALTYLIQPAYSRLIDTRSDIAAKSSLRDAYNQSVNQVQKLKQNYQGIVQAQGSISSIFPPAENVTQLVNQIAGLAKANSLKVEVLSLERLAVRPSVEKSFARGIGTTRVAFRLAGGYESFRPFIEALETNLNLMDLVSFKVEPTAVLKTGETQFSYSLTIDNYYQAN